MSRLFTFLTESDAESIRRSHRRRAKEIAVSMSKRTSLSKDAPVDSTLSRRSMEDSAISKITSREAGPSLLPTAGGHAWSSASSIYRRSAEEDTVQALMDLSLPRFTKLDDRVIPKTEPWPVIEKSPASPVSAKDGYRKNVTSPCMVLDDISSCSSVGDVSPLDFNVTLLYDSEDSITQVGSIVFSSEEEVLLSSGQEDRRKVRKRDPRPRNQPRLTDVQEYEPMSRPVDVPGYEPTSMERSVDVPAYEPTPKERTVDVLVYEPTPKERPFDVPGYEPTSMERSVDVPAYEPTRWYIRRDVERPFLWRRFIRQNIDRPFDVPTYVPTPRERPADGSAYEPTLRGRLVDDTKSEPTPKKRPVDPKNVPLICVLPPPGDLPDWSDREAMPLIIIENGSAVEKPRTTDGLLPVGSEILLPQSPGVTRKPCQCPCRRIGRGRSILRICQQKAVYLMCRRANRDSTCDRPGSGYSRLRLPNPRRQTTSVSTTRSSEHQLRLLNVIIPQGWIQRRRCRYIVYRKTVTLVFISRQYQQCSPQEFHQTVSLGRPRRISYGISSGKDPLTRVRLPWKQGTVL